MKKALLDTDILSYFLKGDQTVEAKAEHYLQEHSNLTISTITYYEVLGGLEYKEATKQTQRFEEFILKCIILNLSFTSLRHSAKIFGNLKRKGITIGTADILIAGIAIEHQLQLVSNNEKHFEGIEGLEVVNWKKEA